MSDMPNTDNIDVALAYIAKSMVRHHEPRGGQSLEDERKEYEETLTALLNAYYEGKSRSPTEIR